MRPAHLPATRSRRGVKGGLANCFASLGLEPIIYQSQNEAHDDMRDDVADLYQRFDRFHLAIPWGTDARRNEPKLASLYGRKRRWLESARGQTLLQSTDSVLLSDGIYCPASESSHIDKRFVWQRSSCDRRGLECAANRIDAQASLFCDLARNSFVVLRPLTPAVRQHFDWCSILRHQSLRLQQFRISPYMTVALLFRQRLPDQ